MKTAWSVLLVGCATAVSLPPVTPQLTGVAGKEGVSAGSLERGRAILANQCVACHGLQPIGKYSVGEWHGIVDEMAPKAKLSASQKQDLLAYLVTVRKTAQ